jgi:hypothetical protein
MPIIINKISNDMYFYFFCDFETSEAEVVLLKSDIKYWHHTFSRAPEVVKRVPEYCASLFFCQNNYKLDKKRRA